MNSSQDVALKLAGTIFGVLCVAHVWRVFTGLRVVVGDYAVPPSLSLIAAAISGALSLWMWRLATQRR